MGTPGGNRTAPALRRRPGQRHTALARVTACLLAVAVGLGLLAGVAAGAPDGARPGAVAVLADPASGAAGIADESSTAAAIVTEDGPDTAAELVPTAGDDEGGEEQPGEIVPLAQVTAGVGSTVGVTVGTRCLGVVVGARRLGCTPELRPSLTLDVDSRLLPGG